MSKVLVTGATGFIGSALYESIRTEKIHRVYATVRNHESAKKALQNGVNVVHVADLLLNADWSPAVADISVVIHTAGRVHVIDEHAKNPLAEFRRINVCNTVLLARQAAEHGVRRFIFLSSIGVNGAETNSHPFNENSKPNPYSPYTQSKWEAEVSLLKLAKETDMEIVIIRPPLVYGPGSPGNFSRLLNFVAKGIPIPLGMVANRRSFVALTNLIDLIKTCIDHPKAGNQTFLVSDDQDLSIVEFIRHIGASLDKHVTLIPVPILLLKAGAVLIGKGDRIKSLTSSLQVDISKVKNVLNWSPPVSIDEELARTARWYWKTRV